MNVKRSLNFVILFLMCVLTCANAQAESYHYQGGPGCVLHKFSNGVWGEGPASELEGQEFGVKPYGKYGTQWSAKVNGTWYYADKDCFKSVEAASNPSPAPTPTPSKQSVLLNPLVNPLVNPQKPAVRRVVRARKKYGVDLSGSYWMMMSNSSKAHSQDFSIITASLNKLGAALGGKARFTYLLKPEHELSIGFGYTTGSRDGLVVGGGSESKIAEQVSDTQVALGYRYLLGGSVWVPFVGVDLSYNMLYQKDTITITSTNGAAVGYSGNGLGYGLNVGSYYNLNEKIRLLADLHYSIISAKLKVKETTDAASFTVGADGGILSLTHLGLNLGIGYCF